MRAAAPSLVLPLLLAVTAFAGGTQTGRGYLDMSAGYKTGDFGTPTTANLYYLSPALGFIAPRYNFSITLPYLSLTNETAGSSSTESGIGDIILRGSAVLLPEGDGGTSLNGSIAIKLPTADEAKGLGSGEIDYGAFLGLRQRVGGVKLYLMSGYIKIGDTSFIDSNDVFLCGVGMSTAFGRTGLYASIEGRRAVVPGTNNPLEITLGFFHVLSADFTLKGSAFLGMNDGGPDSGLAAGFIIWL